MEKKIFILIIFLFLIGIGNVTNSKAYTTEKFSINIPKEFKETEDKL